MKTSITLFSVLFFSTLAGCNSQYSEESSKKFDTTLKVKNSVLKSVPSIREPEKTAIYFLMWYRNNKEKLSSYRLVNNAGEETFDSTKFYSVNFKEAEKYLNDVKTSGCVSFKYLEHWRKYFEKADRQFKSNPQNDGAPENFDYDFVMQSQEVDEDLRNLNKITVAKSIKGNIAKLILHLYSTHKLEVSLSLENQIWLIDDIKSVSDN